jgi:signal transduction histidine kinase
VLIQVALHFHHVEERLADADQDNLEAARAVAASFEAALADVRSTEFAMGTAAEWLAPQALNDYLRANLEHFAAARDYSWLDAAGSVLASSDTTLVGRDLSTAPVVRRAMGGEGWVVSSVVIEPTGERVFHAALRIDRDGSLKGIMLTTVSLERLDIARTNAKRGADATVGLFDPAGQLAYRGLGVPPSALNRLRPDPSQRPALVDPALSGHEAAGAFALPPSEEPRLGAFVPVRSIGWVAAASRARAAVLGPLEERALRDMSILFMMVVLAFASALKVSRYVTRPLDDLEQHARKLATGDLRRIIIPTGPAELRSLAVTFNEMAEELLRHQAEREALVIAEQQARAEVAASRRIGEMREEMVRMVSHDLRSPLQIMLMQSQVLQRSFGRSGDEERARRAGDIVTSGHRMEAMICDLVESVRLESGQVQLVCLEIDLGRFVREFADRFRPIVGGREIELAVSDSLCAVRADPDRLERILANLVGNAFKHGGGGAPVTIAATENGNVVAVSVIDRGPGIAPEIATRLFGRFVRAPGSRVEGLGLGLYITRMLVEAHGGRIRVNSKPGLGTTFTFTLPKASVAVAELHA